MKTGRSTHGRLHSMMQSIKNTLKALVAPRKFSNKGMKWISDYVKNPAQKFGPSTYDAMEKGVQKEIYARKTKLEKGLSFFQRMKLRRSGKNLPSGFYRVIVENVRSGYKNHPSDALQNLYKLRNALIGSYMEGQSKFLDLHLTEFEDFLREHEGNYNSHIK